MAIEGLEEPIGTTDNHPFWSEERKKFIPAGELRVGEKLLSATEKILYVASISPRGPPEDVFNLEVSGEHTYYVSGEGVLVHNGCGKSIALGRDPYFKNLAVDTGSFHYRQWADEGITLKSVRPEGRFGRAFHQAAHKAKKIHFALDGIDDAKGFAKLGRHGFIKNRFTAAELYKISRDPVLLAKTIFYRGGKVVANPF